MIANLQRAFENRRVPTGPTAGTVLVLQLPSDWDFTGHARDLASWVGRLGHASERLVRATATLLENAGRHSSGGPVRLAMCTDARSGDFRVQTTNLAQAHDAERLLQRVDLIRVRGASEAYRGLLCESAEEGRQVGLGLARLGCEARVHLAARSRADELQVVASSRVAAFLPMTVVEGARPGDLALYLQHPVESTIEPWEQYAHGLAERVLNGCGEGDARLGQRLALPSCGIDGILRVRGLWARGEA